MAQETIPEQESQAGANQVPRFLAAQIRRLVGARVRVSLELSTGTGDEAQWSATETAMDGVIMAPPTTREGVKDKRHVNIMFAEPVGEASFATTHPHFLGDAPFSLKVFGEERLARLSFTILHLPDHLELPEMGSDFKP